MFLPSVNRQLLDDAFLYGRLMVCDYEALVRSIA